VRFDSTYFLGVVIELKDAAAFDIKEGIKDVKVVWSGGGIFWCLDFTLVLVSRD